MDHQSDKDTSRPEVNLPKMPTPFFQTPTVKMIMIGFLALFLLIPLQFVKDLISERSQRKNEVIKEVSEKWGSSVNFYGPILKVPYTEVNSKYYKYAYLFPEKLENQTTVETKPLNRNIYDATVYTVEMNFKGSYIKPDFDIQNIPAGNIHWDKATILIQTTNLKSIKDQVGITFGGKPYTFEPIYNSNSGFEALETGPINMTAATFPTSFQFKIKYDGSQLIKMVPIGKTTEMSMKSNWHSPGFTGNFLPNDKTKVITNDGFQAKWKVLHINRAFSQQYFNSLPDLSKYAFGVNFIVPVDEYQKNERVSKYGFLVIGLTFLTFFLIQSISKIRIHIFQYCMIGIALVLFYTLLIAITEHSSFRLAYILSGIGVVLMISLYSFSILKNPKFPLLIGTSLSALYVFIYIIIQMENYALLVGSIGLFIILGLVMYLSRKIDWNSN
jgi:inner membrane protein